MCIMSKIIILNGSPRKNGSNARLLRHMEKELTHLGNVVTYIDIQDLNLNFCSGCCSCYKTGKCHIEDDAEKLSKEIEGVDGLILASPTYVSNVPGQLKTFIDRGHFVIEQLLHDKYAISIVTGENHGSKQVSQLLSQLLTYAGATLSGKIIQDLSFNGNPLEDERMTRKLGYLSRKFDKDIKMRKQYIFQKIFHKLVFSIGIKPFVLRKGNAYEGVIKRWKQQHII